MNYDLDTALHIKRYKTVLEGVTFTLDHHNLGQYKMHVIPMKSNEISIFVFKNRFFPVVQMHLLACN